MAPQAYLWKTTTRTSILPLIARQRLMTCNEPVTVQHPQSYPFFNIIILFYIPLYFYFLKKYVLKTSSNQYVYHANNLTHNITQHIL